MKKLVLAGLFALAIVAFSSSQASATYPCYDVYRPCWEIPLPRFPLVIPNIKFTCANCCPSGHCFKQPWYQYYPPQANYGYTSPWMNYSAPHAYPYAAGAPANYGNYAGGPAQGYPQAPQATAPNYNGQGYFAGQDFGAQGSFAPPAYWYGR